MDDTMRKTDDDSNTGEFVPLFGDWRDELLLDSFAMALAESGKVLRKECRDELTAAIHRLELQVAELRGEWKGMREDRRTDSVVELPRSGWKHDAA